MIDKDNYIAEKFIYLIIFGGIEGEYKDQEWITSINILQSIKVVVEELVRHCYLSLDTKERIYNILSISRSIKSDNYEERLELINNIIKTVNSQRRDNSEIFYNFEMMKRYGDVYELTKEVEEEIEQSIAYDFIFLYLHNTDPDDFSNYINDFSEFPQQYTLSMNAILIENPYLLKDKNIVANMHTTLNLISKHKGFRKAKKADRKLTMLVKKLGNS